MEAITGEEYLDITGFKIPDVFSKIREEGLIIKKIPVEYYLWINTKKGSITYAPSLYKEFSAFTTLGKNELEVDKRLSKIEREIENNYKTAIYYLNKFNELNNLSNTTLGIIGSTAHKLCDKTEDLDVLIITTNEELGKAKKLACKTYFTYSQRQIVSEIEIDIGTITFENLRKHMESNSIYGIIYAKYIDEIINPKVQDELESIKKELSKTPAFSKYKALSKKINLKRKELALELGF